VVTGTGKENVPTTQTQVTFSVVSTSPSAALAQAHTAATSATIVSALLAANVSNLSTVSISLSPNYITRNNTQILQVFDATNRMSFIVNTSRAGALIDEVVSKGATAIDGVNFKSRPQDIHKAQTRAVEEATMDALSIADATLTPLDLCFLNNNSSSVASVKVDMTSSLPPPFPFYADVLGASTPVLGGTTNVEAQVTLKLKYIPCSSNRRSPSPAPRSSS